MSLLHACRLGYSEVKAYTKPPPAVEMVLSAVMVLFKEKTDWATAKRKISESNFLSQIKLFDKDNVTPATMQKVKKYTSKPEFKADLVKASSSAAAALCTWVIAIEIYATVAKEVAPKRAKLHAAMTELKEKQDALRVAKAALEAVIAKVKCLVCCCLAVYVCWWCARLCRERAVELELCY
jgi:dynein heavy chain